MRYGSQHVESAKAEEKNRLADLLLQAGPTYIHPASLAQQRLWILDQLQAKNSGYNVHLGLWLRGSLDLTALHSSIQEMVNRHDSLRTALRLEGKKLQQVVADTCNVAIPITDLTGVADPTAEAYQLARREVMQPFDLGKAPLFRVLKKLEGKNKKKKRYRIEKV